MAVNVKSNSTSRTLTENSQTQTNVNKITSLEGRPTIYIGTSATPPSNWKNGDIYVQY